MKINKLLFAAILTSVMGGSITSCSESFLDEELKTQYSTDRFKTQEGLDELVTGAYQKLKFKFNYICTKFGHSSYRGCNAQWLSECKLFYQKLQKNIRSVSVKI